MALSFKMWTSFTVPSLKGQPLRATRSMIFYKVRERSDIWISVDNFMWKEIVQEWGKIITKPEILRESMNSDPGDARKTTSLTPPSTPKKPQSC